MDADIQATGHLCSSWTLLWEFTDKGNLALQPENLLLWIASRENLVSAGAEFQCGWDCSFQTIYAT
jgi:hypothetical protein